MKHISPKVLFVLKKRFQYGDGYPEVRSSGLYNSARFVNDMLNTSRFTSKLVEVIDNNDIDREVTSFGPSIVIVEALWVVPEKFDVLKKLHPNVTWIVRLHSEIPFLAVEGVAMGWIKGYIDRGVFIGFNSKQTMSDFESLFGKSGGQHHWAIYLPNFYPVANGILGYQLNKKDTIDVGCFGAIRPMKNQLIQAIAAIEFAEKHNLGLRFHINTTRIDSAEVLPVLRNLRSLFTELDRRYVLIEHGWYDHRQFLEVIRHMDIGLQVSMSETFNIVAADFVSENVPLVGSTEIKWLPQWLQAETTNTGSIVKCMERALQFKKSLNWTDYPRNKLRETVQGVRGVWIDALTFLDEYPFKHLTTTQSRHK